MSTRHTYDVLRSAMLAGLLLWSGVIAAQDPTGPTETSSAASLNDSVRELRQQIRELQAAVIEIRSEAQQYRAETTELRRELQAVRTASGVGNPAASELAAGTTAYGSATEAQRTEAQEDQKTQHAATLEEEYQLLSGKIDE